jgi:hypothetical protein
MAIEPSPTAKVTRVTRPAPGSTESPAGGLADLDAPAACCVAPRQDDKIRTPNAPLTRQPH